MANRELYFISGSPPCWSVMLALAVKGLNYIPKRLDNAKREQKAPAFLAVNRRGQVPVLIEDGTTVCETLAVLSYLDAAHTKPGLFGGNAVETAQVWQAISECNGNLSDHVGDISRPLFRGKGAEFAEQIAKAIDKVRTELTLIETKLTSQDWIAGNTLSAADLVTYPVIMQLVRAADREAAEPHALAVHPLDQHFPKISAWAERMEALPGYDDAYPPHWKA